MVERFSFTYEDAKKFGFTYDDLRGITEEVPNKVYRLRTTTGNRKRKIVHGNIVKAVQELKKLNKSAELEIIERPKMIKKVIDNITFEEAVDMTFDYLIKLGETTDAIDLNTVFDYRKRTDMYLFDFFPPDSKLSTINEEKIKEFVSYMFKREKKNGDGLLSLSSVEKAYSTLNWIIRYCSEISSPPLLKDNYLNYIQFKALIPKGRGKKIRRDRSHSLIEIQKIAIALREKANVRLKTMVSVIIDTGCRVEECIGLKWSSIDLSTGLVNYTEAITSKISKKNSSKHCGTRSKELKSNQSYRDNYLTPETIQYLKNLKVFMVALGLSVNDGDYIFTRWDSNQVLSPISFADEYKDFIRKQKLDYIPLYDFRHFLINLLLENNMTAKDVARYVGNTPRTLLENYTETSKDVKSEIKDVVNNVVRSKSQKIFDIDTVVKVLNYNDKYDDEDVFSVLDFVANKTICKDEVPLILENTRNLILEQYPNFKTFCDDNSDIIKAKLETYKTFNSVDVELVQNPNYYLSNIEI